MITDTRHTTHTNTHTQHTRTHTHNTQHTHTHKHTHEHMEHTRTHTSKTHEHTRIYTQPLIGTHTHILHIKKKNNRHKHSNDHTTNTAHKNTNASQRTPRRNVEHQHTQQCSTVTRSPRVVVSVHYWFVSVGCPLVCVLCVCLFVASMEEPTKGSTSTTNRQPMKVEAGSTQTAGVCTSTTRNNTKPNFDHARQRVHVHYVTARTPYTLHTSHNTQYTTHNTQHITHNTLHTTHNTQRTQHPLTHQRVCGCSWFFFFVWSVSFHKNIARTRRTESGRVCQSR